MELEEAVDYHSILLNMSHKLNKLYSFIIFQEFSLLSFLLCLTAFHVVMGNNLFKRGAVFFHGIAALIDLFIYSYGGQKISDCTKEVCDDCYNLHKNYMIIMLRSQKELKIKSMIYHASLPEFTKILNKTISLIAMLQSFM